MTKPACEPTREAQRETVERLEEEIRQILDMTQSPAWRRIFAPLEEAAVAAAGRLPTEEEPVLFFRSQGTLAVARILVAQLRRPFLDLKALAPRHPLAGQTLPCAEAFDLAVERAFGTCRRRQEEPTHVRRGGRGRKASPGAVPASQPAEHPARAKTPASRKFKHPWRGKFSDRMGRSPPGRPAQRGMHPAPREGPYGAFAVSGWSSGQVVARTVHAARAGKAGRVSSTWAARRRQHDATGGLGPLLPARPGWGIVRLGEEMVPKNGTKGPRAGTTWRCRSGRFGPVVPKNGTKRACVPCRKTGAPALMWVCNKEKGGGGGPAAMFLWACEAPPKNERRASLAAGAFLLLENGAHAWPPPGGILAYMLARLIRVWIGEGREGPCKQLVGAPSTSPRPWQDRSGPGAEAGLPWPWRVDAGRRLEGRPHRSHDAPHGEAWFRSRISKVRE